MKLGLFNKPLKREKEYDQVLTSNTPENTTDDEDAVVFAGSIRGGNLEAYLNEIGHDSANVADTDVDDTNDMKLHIEEAISSISADKNSDTEDKVEQNNSDTENKVEQNNSDTEDNVEQKNSDTEDKVEQNNSDTEDKVEQNNSDTEDNVEAEENEESVISEVDDTSDNENDNQDLEENEGHTDNENSGTIEENLGEIIEETEHSDDFTTDSNEVDNVSVENDDLKYTEESDNTVSDLDDSSATETNEEANIDAELSNGSTVESNENVEGDYILDLDDTDNKIETEQSSDLVHNTEHKDLVCNEVSMKEKFISLDLAEKKEYIQKLFAEFDELSEYLIEYRDKIDQKIADMQQIIKSLYIQISTCDLEDARSIVEKIQKYSKHNKSLDELKDYIDNIMLN